MNCFLVTCLLVFAKTALSDSSDDPSGWNSYFETNSHYHTDAVDIVDPSGWNYDRESKSSIRSEQEDQKQIVKLRESVVEKENLQLNHKVEKENLQLIQKVEKENLQLNHKVEKENLQLNYKVEKEIQAAVNSKVETLAYQHKRISTKKENVAFAKRFVSILLQSADLSQKTVDDGQDVSRFIEIRISAEHLKTLVHFTNSIVNVSMGELDTILTASIHSSDVPVSSISESINQIFFMDNQKQIWIPFFLVIMFGLFQLIKASQTITRFVITVIILVFTVGFFVEYYRMYKEIEIRQRITLEKHGDMPSSCSSKDRSLWTAIQNSFTFSFSKKNDECEQYYKALFLDPLVEVSPVRVLSSVLSDFILHPSTKFGTAIVDFTSAVIGGLPFHYGWIVWSISFLAIFLFFVLAFVIVIGGSIGFHSWFGGVSVRGNQTSQITQPPPAVPAPVAPPLPPTNAMLQAVNEMRNFVLMDANSLGTLMLRAQRNASVHPSGVEELTNSSGNQLPSRPSVDKIDFTKVQQERFIENTHPNSGEEEKETACENINKKLQEKSDSKSTDSPIVQEELLVSFEVIQSTEIQPSSSQADVLKSDVG